VIEREWDREGQGGTEEGTEGGRGEPTISSQKQSERVSMRRRLRTCATMRVTVGPRGTGLVDGDGADVVVVTLGNPKVELVPRPVLGPA
jgi:hypothetical protein